MIGLAVLLAHCYPTLHTAAKAEDARSFSELVDDAFRTDLKLSDIEATALAKKHMLKCRNVTFAGPVGASFEEIHVLTQANSRIFGKSRADRELAMDVERSINRGFQCRQVTGGYFCQGMRFLEPSQGEVVRPPLRGFIQHGEAFGNYLGVLINMEFSDGRKDLVLVHVERRNTRCLTKEDAPGMYSGMRWPYAPVRYDGKPDVLTELTPPAQPERAQQSLLKPSFDCSKSSSEVENLICTDSELSVLDAEYGDAYRRTKSMVSDAMALKKQSVTEWKWREANCRDKACLVSWYEKRRTQLKEWVAHPGH